MLFKKEADNLYARLDSQEVAGEVQYFRRDRIFPAINPDGSVNWRNAITGGYWEIFGIRVWKLWGAVAFVLVAVGTIVEIHLNFRTCSEVMSRLNLGDIKNATDLILNWTGLNLSK